MYPAIKGARSANLFEYKWYSLDNLLTSRISVMVKISTSQINVLWPNFICPWPKVRIRKKISESHQLALTSRPWCSTKDTISQNTNIRWGHSGIMIEWDRGKTPLKLCLSTDKNKDTGKSMKVNKCLPLSANMSDHCLFANYIFSPTPFLSHLPDKNYCYLSIGLILFSDSIKSREVPRFFKHSTESRDTSLNPELLAGMVSFAVASNTGKFVPLQMCSWGVLAVVNIN